jgi:hypothetical protein
MFVAEVIVELIVKQGIIDGKINCTRSPGEKALIYRSFYIS